MIAASLFFRAAAHGAPVCAKCHPKETARYLQSGMGNSLGPPAPVPGGRITHERSGSVISVEQRDGRMVQSLAERGLTAEYPIAYQIGSGKVAHGYIAQAGDYLIQSPATWYNPRGWDISPAFVTARMLDFDRVVNETCILCHAGAAKFSGADGRRFAGPALTAITCERCHGASDDHVLHPSAKNIVNPAKLPARARDSVCEQCHLEGAARILNPGKTWLDFHAGDNLEQTVAVYMLKRNGRPSKAASHAEQLAESKCARESGGKLWCGSCHNPHSQTSDRNREIRDVCSSCHRSLSKAAHPGVQSECVSCHMPGLSPKDVLHEAITDHRILRRPGVALESPGADPETLAAWSEPPSEFRQRDLGLAEMEFASRHVLTAMGVDGAKLLETLPSSQKDGDPAVLAARAAALLRQNKAQEALALCRVLVEKQPNSAQYALYLAITLKRAHEFAEAEKQLRRAIELDPSLQEPYFELASLIGIKGRLRETAEAIDQYLKWNPQSISFRVAKPRDIE